MPAEKTIQPYKAHNFCGHSPIWQVDNTRKFLTLHAKSKAAKTILNRLAHKKGKAKNNKLKLAKKHKNLPA